MEVCMPYKITQLDIDKIYSTGYKTLWEWYDLLNSWKWPQELLPEEEISRPYNSGGRRAQLMNIIKKKVGEKYLLREHNRSSMSEEEFEDFWQGNYCNDKEAYARYKERQKKAVDEMIAKMHK